MIMKEKFRIYQLGDKQIIERIVFPRFKAVITFNSPISDIEDIELIDDTSDAMIVATAMREAGDFIYKFSK